MTERKIRTEGKVVVTEIEMTLIKKKIEIAEAGIEDLTEGDPIPGIPLEVNPDPTADHEQGHIAITDHLPGITGDLLETPRSFAYCTNQEMIMTFTNVGQLKEWMEKGLARE